MQNTSATLTIITTCRRKRQLSGVTARAGTAAQEFAWAGVNYELGESGHTRWHITTLR